MKRSVLIVESPDTDGDPGSEGSFIKHMLDLMGIKNNLQIAKNKQQFINLLSSLTADIEVIHIATHGKTRIKRGKEEFVGFWTPDDQYVTVKGIAEAGISLSRKVVVSTACLSGQKASRDAFKIATDCKHYIAPIRGPDFYNAALMCHIFYHKHFVLKRSAREAFSEYRDRYKNPHKFCFV